MGNGQFVKRGKGRFETTLPIADCWLRIGKKFLYPAGRGQRWGRITTLSIAGCWLSVEKNKNWIPVCTGMTREQESEKWAREREMRLLIGATLCGRPKKTIGKWQLIIKISSTHWGEDKGEGEITTLPIAGCWLRIGKTI